MSDVAFAVPELTRSTSESEVFSCVICTQIFLDPVTLHCGHSSCKLCLFQVVSSHADFVDLASPCTIKCPSGCQSSFRYPSFPPVNISMRQQVERLFGERVRERRDDEHVQTQEAAFKSSHARPAAPSLVRRLSEHALASANGGSNANTNANTNTNTNTFINAIASAFTSFTTTPSPAVSRPGDADPADTRQNIIKVGRILFALPFSSVQRALNSIDPTHWLTYISWIIYKLSGVVLFLLAFRSFSHVVFPDAIDLYVPRSHVDGYGDAQVNNGDSVSGSLRTGERAFAFALYEPSILEFVNGWDEPVPLSASSDGARAHAHAHAHDEVRGLIQHRPVPWYFKSLNLHSSLPNLFDAYIFGNVVNYIPMMWATPAQTDTVYDVLDTLTFSRLIVPLCVTPGTDLLSRVLSFTVRVSWWVLLSLLVPELVQFSFAAYVSVAARDEWMYTTMTIVSLPDLLQLPSRVYSRLVRLFSSPRAFRDRLIEFAIDKTRVYNLFFAIAINVWFMSTVWYYVFILFTFFYNFGSLFAPLFRVVRDEVFVTDDEAAARARQQE